MVESYKGGKQWHGNIVQISACLTYTKKTEDICKLFLSLSVENNKQTHNMQTNNIYFVSTVRRQSIKSSPPFNVGPDLSCQSKQLMFL